MGFELSDAHRVQGRTSDKEVKADDRDAEGRRTDQEALKLCEEKGPVGVEPGRSSQTWRNGLERQSELGTTALGV